MPVATPAGSTLNLGRRVQLNINDKTLCFARAIPRSTREIVTNEDIICGDIDADIADSQKGRHIVGWSIFIDVTWPILDLILPLLGVTDLTLDVCELGAVDVPEIFSMQLNMIDGDTIVHDIPECYTAQWALRGSKGSRPVQLQWDIVGSQEDHLQVFTEDPVDHGKMYAFTHSSITLADDLSADVERGTDRFLLQVNNDLVVEHNNSIYITDATIGNREVVLATAALVNADNVDLYFTYRDDETGKKSVLVLDNDVKVLTLLLPTCIAVARPPSISGKKDILRYPMTLMARKSMSGSTRIAPLTITATDPE